VLFSASWCVWCRQFDDLLADTSVGPILASHYVTIQLVTLEIPQRKALENPGSAALMTSLGGDGNSLPFFAVLDSAGRKVGDSNIMPGGGNVGFPSAPEEVAAFDRLIARTAPGATATERARIRAYLNRVAGR